MALILNLTKLSLLKDLIGCCENEILYTLGSNKKRALFNSLQIHISIRKRVEKYQ